jgi:hypothetical protein
MKFVKENLTLVIVGAVVLLFMVAAFAYPMPQWRSGLREEMTSRADQGKTVRDLGNKPLELPGVATQKGAPTAAWVEKKKAIIDDVNKAKGDVDKEAHERNSQMRVDKSGIPLLPVPRAVDLGPANVGVQLLNPDKKGLLPNPSDPMEFKFKYQQLFRIWTNLLVAGKIDDPGASPPAFTPPKLEDLSAAFTAQEMRSAAALPPGAGGAGLGAPTVNASLTNKRFYDFAKAGVMNRASGLQMYVEPSPQGFQIRDWAFRDQAPFPQQVFEGLVDTWIQADIVKAIVLTNNKSMGVGLDRNVGKAAVKRLTRIMIGNNARARVLGSTTGSPGMMAGAPAGGGQVADPGPLFFTSGNAGSTASGGQVMGPQVNSNGGTAVAPVEATDNAINFELSMTGRSGGKAYDIVHVSVLVDIDPAQLNAFVRSLYMQNMGYVQESLQIRTVDPTERASYGYLYGEGQVVEAEIQFEALFFRNWTAPLMPESVRQALGVTAPATTPAQ